VGSTYMGMGVGSVCCGRGTESAIVKRFSSEDRVSRLGRCCWTGFIGDLKAGCERMELRRCFTFYELMLRSVHSHLLRASDQSSVVVHCRTNFVEIVVPG